MTTAPPLTGQDINLAAHATRTLLISELEPFGLTFEQWIVLNLVGSGQAATADAIRRRLLAALGVDGPTADDLLAGLVRVDLLEEQGDDVRLTSAGEQRWQEAVAVVADLVAALYAGIDGDDMATTRRVLVEVTERAQVRLGARPDR